MRCDTFGLLDLKNLVLAVRRLQHVESTNFPSFLQQSR